MTEAVPLLPVCVFRALIWTILPLSQSLMLLCQWSATKMDKDAFGDDFKKGFLRAWRVLSTCIRTNSKISLWKKHGSQEGLLLLLLLFINYCHCHYIEINKHRVNSVWDTNCLSSGPQGGLKRIFTFTSTMKHWVSRSVRISQHWELNARVH